MIGSNSTSAGISVFKGILFIAILCLLQQAGFSSTNLKIKKIRFLGNRTFSEKSLKNILKSHEGQPFDARLMKLDRILLTNYYLLNGFMEVFIASSFSREANKIFLIYDINEGRRYFLKEIRFLGNSLISREELRKRIPLKDGEPFNQTAVDEGIKKIEDFYFDRGKPYLQIEASRAIEEDSLIILSIFIKEDVTVFIRDIAFQGLAEVKSSVIRRELVIHKGDAYSRKKIQESQRNIYSTGLFSFVNFHLIPLDSARSRVRLVIRVVEKKPRWVGVRFGLAYDQEIVYGGTFDFTLEGGHRNLFGTGRSASVSIIPSLIYDFEEKRLINRKNQYSLTYVEPWIGYTRTPGILQLSYFQVRPSFTEFFNFINASFKISHEFNNRWTLSNTLSFQRLRTLEENKLDSLDFVYAISLELSRDNRDNFLNPQRGHLLEFQMKFVYSSSRDLRTGTTESNRFFRLTALWNRYQPFFLESNWTLASRFRGGAILKLGELTRVPILERFYLGGASSVRGYPEQLLGPLEYDENQVPRALGGRLLFLANLELRIPLFWVLYGEVFIDAGNVWSEISDFRPLSIKISSGAGLAVLTPLGPLRFDYGVKWFPEVLEDRGEFHIGISFAF